MSRVQPKDLSYEDKILLRWYFGPGASVFEHSPFGGTLERASMYDNHKATEAQARAWHSEYRELRDEVGVGLAGAELGFGPSATVNITAEEYVAPKFNGNEAELLDAAEASRGLHRLQAIHKQGYTVMALAYGPGFEVWTANGFPLGGLYQLVKPGKRLISTILEEQSKSASKDVQIQLPHLLHNDFKIAEHNVDGERLAMHGAAEGAAEKLLDEVSSVWVDLHRGEKRRKMR